MENIRWKVQATGRLIKITKRRWVITSFLLGAKIYLTPTNLRDMRFTKLGRVWTPSKYFLKCKSSWKEIECWQWKEEQPSKVSLLEYADLCEPNENIARECKKLDNNYVPFLDNTRRYIAIGKQSGWSKGENLLEIFIWDVLYCKEASKLRCTVHRG